MTHRARSLAYDYLGMFPDEGGPHRRSRVATPPAAQSVVVALLGEVALRREGALTAVPGTRSRLLLASLALRRGRSRSAQALIDDVWADQPPRAPMNALHTQVSRLRSALPDGALEIGPAGYRLTLSVEQVDLALAGDLLLPARRDRERGDGAGCLDAVARARALWRGEPGADLPSGEVADALRDRAAEILTHLDLLELAARQDMGDIDGALGLARRRAASDPLDEPAEATLMRLLATAGRANEALESFAAFRTRLADQLGADPGRALVELNTAILRGEPIDRAESGVAGTRPTGSISPVLTVVTGVADSLGDEAKAASRAVRPADGTATADGRGSRTMRRPRERHSTDPRRRGRPARVSISRLGTRVRSTRFPRRSDCVPRRTRCSDATATSTPSWGCSTPRGSPRCSARAVPARRGSRTRSARGSPVRVRC